MEQDPSLGIELGLFYKENENTQFNSEHSTLAPKKAILTSTG